ncbi:hypothetical protein [Jidongwangia harbinensis]|uniref:hypothetical protein n=1 Tax=Jidongwangia harbinensis TaxID=2878561 RepID=UPI001CD92ED1|nr:hypothetical protein [Jidongwangia harbinensis]MCA2216021.1 hypothetical protein [Jidongwangia harbinensis]
MINPAAGEMVTHPAGPPQGQREVQAGEVTAILIFRPVRPYHRVMLNTFKSRLGGS